MRNGIVALSGHARVKRGETTIVPREQPLRGVGCNDTASRKAPRNGKNDSRLSFDALGQGQGRAYETDIAVRGCLEIYIGRSTACWVIASFPHQLILSCVSRVP